LWTSRILKQIQKCCAGQGESFFPLVVLFLRICLPKKVYILNTKYDLNSKTLVVFPWCMHTRYIIVIKLWQALKSFSAFIENFLFYSINLKNNRCTNKPSCSTKFYYAKSIPGKRNLLTTYNIKVVETFVQIIGQLTVSNCC